MRFEDCSKSLVFAGSSLGGIVQGVQEGRPIRPGHLATLSLTTSLLGIVAALLPVRLGDALHGWRRGSLFSLSSALLRLRPLRNGPYHEGVRGLGLRGALQLSREALDRKSVV